MVNQTSRPSPGIDLLRGRGSAIIIAVTIVATLVGVSAPASAVARRPGYTITADTGHLTSDQRQRLAAHRITYGGTAARTITRTPQDDDLRTACAAHPTEAGTPPLGWLRDRYQQCFSKRLDFIAVNDQTGAPAGEITFQLWLLGWANNGARQVDYLLSVEDITVSTIPGNVIDWPTQAIAIGLRGCTSGDEITCASGVSKTVDGWYRVPAQGMTYSSPPGTGAGDDKIVRTGVVVDVTVGTLPIRPGTQYDVVETNMRFDSGRGIARANGSVFPNFTPVFALSLSDPTVRESARHIYDAQNNPERTFPSWVGKTVPGKTEALHRLFDDTLQGRNRAAAIAVCVDVWGDWSGTGQQCDEYPFATTQEGAYTGTIANGGLQRFSARLIDGTDNVTAGARLGATYSDQRVLPDEAFLVRVDP